MLKVEPKLVKLLTTILLVHLMEIQVVNEDSRLYRNKERKVMIVLATLPVDHLAILFRQYLCSRQNVLVPHLTVLKVASKSKAVLKSNPAKRNTQLTLKTIYPLQAVSN